MRKLALSIAAVLTLSASAAQPNDTVNGRMYRLFVPLTFYHNVAGNLLSVSPSGNDVDHAVDEALMNVYLKRPDLVEATETQLEKSGSLRRDLDQPIGQKVDIVEYVNPQPEEPEVTPTDVVVTKPKFWTMKADGFLQFMQNYVSDNWYKGGESNYSALASLTVEATFPCCRNWPQQSDWPIPAGCSTKRWYYTLQVLAWTQFTRGLKSNDYRTYSDFFSPFNLNLGLGMDYKVEAFKKKLTGTINLSPIALNYRYVDRTVFQNKNQKYVEPSDISWFPSRHGIDADKRYKLDPGSQFTADLKWQMSETVQWKSRLWGFTSYERAELEWENTFQLKVSKYITANIFIYPRFDDGNQPDDDLGYWQFKEYTSIGLSYSF